jgi:hypothetical protein
VKLLELIRRLLVRETDIEPEVHGDVPNLDPQMLRPAREPHGFEHLSYLLRHQAD